MLSELLLHESDYDITIHEGVPRLGLCDTS